MSSETLPYTKEPHPITGMYSGKFGVWLFLASEVMLFGALFSAYVLLRVGATDWPKHGTTGLSVSIGMFNTLVLILSSVTMVLSWAYLKLGEVAKGRMCLGLTMALALVFLVVKLTMEYNPKLHHYGVWVQGEEQPMTGHIQAEHDDYIMFIPDAAHGADSGHEAASSEGEAHEAIRIERSNIVRMSNFGPAYNTFFATYYTITGLHGLHIVGGIIVIAYLLWPGAGMLKSDPERYANRVECTGLYWHFVDLVWIFLFPTFYLL